MKKRTSPPPTAQIAERLTPAWCIVATTLFLTPLVFDALGKDNFRLPKELTFRASAIALLAVFLLWGSRKSIDGLSRIRSAFRDPVIVAVTVIVAWAGITAVLSVNRRLSVDSLITVAAGAIFFLGARGALKQRPMALFNILLAAAGLNALVVILQRYRIWQPFFPLPGERDVGPIGLLGNSNDAGTFLLVPAIAAIVGAAATHGRRRFVYVGVAALLTAGVVASGTRTAVAALGLAVTVLAFTSGTRTRLLALICAGCLTLLATWQGTQLGRRNWGVLDALLVGRFDVALSQRLPAFLTAVEMFKDAPLTGMGPGTYKWLYMRYRLGLVENYPENWIGGWPANFAEVHNDHLQIAAETGIVGYVLFIGVVVLAAKGARISTIEDRTADVVARLARAPVIVAVMSVMLLQFPLQLAASRIVLLFFGALFLPTNDDDD